MLGGGKNQSFMDQSASADDGVVNVQNEQEGDPPNEYEVKLNKDGSKTTTYTGSGGGDETDYITYVDSEGNEIDSEELDVNVEYTSGPGNNPVKNPTPGSRLYHGKSPTDLAAYSAILGIITGGSSSATSTLGFAAKNKNTNNASGNFVVYIIKIGKKLFKVGKADADRITKSTGLPTRLHQQVRKLSKTHKDVQGKIVSRGHSTTKRAKEAETGLLNRIFGRTKKVPPGNRKSYKPKK